MLKERTEATQVVREYPTCDFRPIPPETLAAVASEIAELLSTDSTVVVMDSGGEIRTKAVCKHMGTTEDSSHAA